MLLQVNGYLYYNGTSKIYHGCAIPNNSQIGVMLDMDCGSLSYIVDGVDKGVAIQNEELKSGEYYITLN